MDDTKITKQNQSPYDFRIKNLKVKIVFSQNPKAPTLETALANIAIRKLG